MKQHKSCSTCIRGKTLPINDDILCREKGVVSHDYVCSRYKSDPMQKSAKETGYKCISCENFILDIQKPGEPASIGLCQLFSVRKFDGTKKNACSKFVRKTRLEVS